MSPERHHAAAINRRVTLGIWAFTAVAWIAGIAADALNLPEHLFAAALTLALAGTIVAGNSMLIARLTRCNEIGDRNNELLADAYKVLQDLQGARPDPAVTPPPWHGLRSAEVVELRAEPAASPRRTGASPRQAGSPR